MSASTHVPTIIKWFDLQPESRPIGQPRLSRLPSVKPNHILLITGPSGSGKSSLLRRFRQRAQPRQTCWTDLSSVTLPDLPVVDCFGDEPLERVLQLLSQVGLAEAWTYLKRPGQLSDGQRWRLQLALALCQTRGTNQPTVLASDEFTALLDRVTAAIVARCLRRIVTATPGLSAIVATSHEDLIRPLSPDGIMRCDFGAVKSIPCHPRS